jgi:tryptophan synthase beta chain
MKLNTKFNQFGGTYVPEMLIPALEELEEAFIKIKDNTVFKEELTNLLKTFAGRETPLHLAKNISKEVGCKVYLKREDLLHTGAHKINNTLGQGLLAKYMGKKEIIAETGAGQHGVATAAIGSLLNIPVKVFMGEKDIQRQQQNVQRMKMFGAQVISATTGSKTLKDAVNEALRYYLQNCETSFYLIGSVVGPHPYPTIVEHFQTIIGKEAKKQIQEKENTLPTHIIACVGGGSNAIGIFNEFTNEQTQLIGVEAGGKEEKHGKTLTQGSPGIFQGAFTYVLQTEDGQIQEAHSISAGLDYPAVGPVHAYLKETNKATYKSVTDQQAINAFKYTTKNEGIIPALESSHAIAYVLENKAEFKSTDIVIINLSGRGDKDIDQLTEVQ